VGVVAEQGSSTSSLDRSTVVALVAMALGVFVIANDFTALSVAIPAVEHDLDTTLSKAQWVINGYALVFGVLIVTGGRLADLLGRKRMFLVGATIFATFSLLCGLAPGVATLIASRGLMGVGGALMWPAVLGMTYAILPEDKAGLAGGLILGVAGLGNAAGPLIGGVLTEALSWRWVFFLNLPIAAFAMVVVWRSVPEERVDSADTRMDYRGVGVLSLGVVCVLVALDEGPSDGFGQPWIVGLLVVGVVALASFLVVERSVGDRALVPRDVLQNRLFARSSVVVLLMSAIFFSALVFLPQLMQEDLGFSALESGVGLLPMMLVFAATSFVAGSLYDRLGARTVVSAGGLFLGLGMVLLAVLMDDEGFWSLVPGMVVLGAGVGLFYSSITTTAVTALDPARSSLAGGIVYMCQIAGGAVGLGINTAIVVSAEHLADGIRHAFLLDAVLAAVGLAIVLRTLPSTGAADRRPHLRHHHRAHAP
jgi:EmrB/QacA subfamily drug resistance transporter